MALFDFLKKTEKGNMSGEVAAAATGKVIPMSEIADGVFASGCMGACVGIDPFEGKVYAPVNGKIIQVAETLHAIGIKSENGAEILIHVGIDTVSMNGDGFETAVKEGDYVKKGQLVLSMDLKKIESAGFKNTVITVVTNSDEYTSVELVGGQEIVSGQTVLLLKK